MLQKPKEELQQVLSLPFKTFVKQSLDLVGLLLGYERHGSGTGQEGPKSSEVSRQAAVKKEEVSFILFCLA